MEGVPWLKFAVTIESTILPCIVSTGGFTVMSYGLNYYIGTLNYSYKLPDPLQVPACNSPIEWYEFTGSSEVLTDETIQSMMWINADEKALKVRSDDFSLLG